MTCARRVADRDLDCLLFGTAIVRTFLFGGELDPAQRRAPDRRGGFHPATEGREVAVSAAHEAQPKARLLAQWINRNRQQNLVTNLVTDVDFATLERDQVRILVVVGIVVLGGYERHRQRKVERDARRFQATGAGSLHLAPELGPQEKIVPGLI